jgi:hypothetical protein
LTSVRKKWKLRTLATYVFLLGVVILTRKSGSSHAAHLRKHSAKRKSNENFGGRFRGGGVIVHTSLVPHLFCSPIPSPFAKRMDTTSYTHFNLIGTSSMLLPIRMRPTSTELLRNAGALKSLKRLPRRPRCNREWVRSGGHSGRTQDQRILTVAPSFQSRSIDKLLPPDSPLVSFSSRQK